MATARPGNLKGRLKSFLLLCSFCCGDCLSLALGLLFVELELGEEDSLELVALLDVDFAETDQARPLDQELSHQQVE